MNKQKASSTTDSGYDSQFSLFSFDAKRSCFDASTPKKINDENSATKTQTLRQQTLAISQQQNAEISHRKATDCFKTFDGNVGAHQVAAHHKETSVKNIFLDRKTIALISLILVFAVLVIAYKMILVAMPYTNSESIYEASSYAQQKFSQILDWAQENKLSTRIHPLLCGLAISLFTFMMVYMDSAIPGVNPSLPFRTNSKADYGHPKSSSINLNYLTALAAGVVVSALMWYEL